MTGYHGLDERSVLAWRLRTQFLGEDAPFYALALYDARGYETGR